MKSLEAARQLAQRICSAAEWRRDRCTWLGRQRPPLDADLYAGTSGIAWFLAHLAATTGDQAALRTAAGAIRHALELVAERPVARVGLHLGDLGVLWAAATVGTRIGDAALVDRACAMVADVRQRLPSPRAFGFDLLGGSAGDLLAMLALARWLGPPAVHEAERIGASLCEGRHEMPYGVAWPYATEGAAARPSPTASADVTPRSLETTPAYHVGMAHGTSGIACALAELADHTTRRFGDTADAALAFERAWFDAGTCSWQDPQTRLPTSTSWCRGSAGVGQARLRLLQLAPAQSPRLQADTGAALASVHTAVASVLSSAVTSHGWETSNVSVCHGLMGAADLLIQAADVLGVEEHRSAAERIVDHCLRQAAAEGRWPCGTADGSESMDLFLGLAGIGTVCLRVALPGHLPPVGLPLAAYSTS